MHDCQLATDFGSPSSRRNVDFFNVDIAGSFNPAESGSGQFRLLEEHHRLTIADPDLDTAVALDRVGFASNNVEELVVGRVAVGFSVAQFDFEVTCVGALVVQNGDDFGVICAALRKGDRSCADIDCGAFGSEVVGVVTRDVAAEEVEAGNQLVEDRSLVV